MKTLLIVDIQKKYRKNFNEEYLNKIKEYIKINSFEYEKIVCIMENNQSLGDFINKELKDKLTIRPIFKCYDEEYSLNKLKQSEKFSFHKNGLKPLFEIPNGDFYIQDNDGYIVGNRNDNNITLDYMNKDLYYLFNFIRNSNIHIIGGGLNHCVKKTKDYLTFLGINSFILKDLCYNIYPQEKPCKIENFNIFIENKQKD